jgi:PKD repeat protein
MTIPVAPLYPDAFDSNKNLYEVHDSLRVTLVEDYLPGKKIIKVTGDTSRFPASGLITLTEQQSEAHHRAISFWYSARTATTFEGLELLPEFEDSAKPKNITHVTQNVIAPHHNNLKDALIAIEEFIGIKGTVDTKPLGPTMEGRINFLRRLVLRPRAWFTVNKRIGIAPLTVQFKDMSFRNPTQWCWNFGDQGISGCSVISMSVISTPSNIVISNANEHTVTKTYFTPGIYDIELTVSNDFGEDTITIPKYITVRVQAPDEATIAFAPDNATQLLISGVLHTRSNALVNVTISDNGEQPSDPITNYTWDMQDDLSHGNAPSAKASYSVGGIYDIRLKTSTALGAYRTTIFKNIINVIERTNLFYMVFPDTSNAITKSVYSYEFGLISETFKIGTRTPQNVTRDYTILSSQPSDVDVQTKEFLRNNGFIQKNSTASGDKGTSLVYWCEGGTPIKVRFKEYVGFTDTWADPLGLTTFNRGWNWVSFPAPGKVYFLLGTDPTMPTNTPGSSLTNQQKDTLSLSNYTFSTPVTFDGTNYKNGADELMQNTGLGTHGDYSVYRTCWKGHTGYIVRNDGVGPYFRLKSFYRTEGTLSEEFQFIRKLPDMPGSMKLDGQLVALSGGIYFFNNSGEIVVWNDTTNIWAVGSPSAASIPFRSLQDQSQPDFDELSNSLVATSDGDRRAFLSFDYSDRVFLKFNEATLSFSSLGSRPTGEQFLMSVY